MDAALHPFGYRIYRQIAGDPESPAIWEPHKDSDELFDALRRRYPSKKTHVERKWYAFQEFRIQEILQEQNMTGVTPVMSGTYPAEPQTGPQSSSTGHIQAGNEEIGNFWSPDQNTGFMPSHAENPGHPGLTMPSYDPSDVSLTMDASVEEQETFSFEMIQPADQPTLDSPDLDYLLMDSSQSSTSQSLATPMPTPGRGPASARQPYTRSRKIKNGYHCDHKDCSKTFDRRCDLNHHKRIHQARSYSCEACDKSFVYAKDLRRHMRRKHEQANIPTVTTHALSHIAEFDDPAELVPAGISETMAGWTPDVGDIHGLGRPNIHQDARTGDVLQERGDGPSRSASADLGIAHLDSAAQNTNGIFAHTTQTVPHASIDEHDSVLGLAYPPRDGLSISEQWKSQKLSSKQGGNLLSHTNTDPASLDARAQAMLSLGNPAEDSEGLYSSFRVRPHSFFCVGRVFLVLWVEPCGKTTAVTSMGDAGIPARCPDESVFSKVRRFVVVRKSHKYCIALPIVSHGPRGVAKRGAQKSEHTIIYTGRTPPERGQTSTFDQHGTGHRNASRPSPIRVLPDDSSARLDPISRIDFGKVHTIQHNTKVKSLGVVHPSSMSALKSQVENIFMNPASAERPSSTKQQNVGKSTSPRAGACNKVANIVNRWKQIPAIPRPPRDPQPRSDGMHCALSKTVATQQAAKLTIGTGSNRATGNLDDCDYGHQLSKFDSSSELWPLLYHRNRTHPDWVTLTVTRDSRTHEPPPILVLREGAIPAQRFPHEVMSEAMVDPGLLLDVTIFERKASVMLSTPDKEFFHFPGRPVEFALDTMYAIRGDFWLASEATTIAKAIHPTVTGGHFWELALALLTLLLLGQRKINWTFSTGLRRRVTPTLKSVSRWPPIGLGRHHSRGTGSMFRAC